MQPREQCVEDAKANGLNSGNLPTGRQADLQWCCEANGRIFLGKAMFKRKLSLARPQTWNLRALRRISLTNPSSRSASGGSAARTAPPALRLAIPHGLGPESVRPSATRTSSGQKPDSPGDGGSEHEEACENIASTAPALRSIATGPG